VSADTNATVMVAVLGLGMVEIVGLYQETAPSLQDMRMAPSGDVKSRQMLLDADLLVGATAFTVGLLASWYMRDPVPFIVVAGGFVMVSAWHHNVLASSNEHIY